MLKFDDFELLKQYYLYGGPKTNIKSTQLVRCFFYSWQYSSTRDKQKIVNIWKNTYFEYINFGLGFLRGKEKSLLRSFDFPIIKEWFEWCKRKNNRINQLMQDELSKRGRQELFDEISKYAPYDIFSIKSYVVENAESLSIETVAFMLFVYVCVRKDYKTDEEVFFLRNELDSINSSLWQGVIRKIYSLIKDDMEMCSLFKEHLHEEFKENVETYFISQDSQPSTFSILQKVEFKLDWHNVEFKKDSIVINPPADKTIKFLPKEIRLIGSKASFNYLKDYFDIKMPDIYCVAYKMQVEVKSEMELERAILYNSGQYKNYIVKKGKTIKSMLTNKKEIMSFEKSYNSGLKIDSNYLKKYNSVYINRLIELQADNYRVIPLDEQFVYSNGNAFTEEAFIFTREMKYSPRHLMAIIENVNPDRATLIFTINKKNYVETINMIYDYMAGGDYNKRSSLRNFEKLKENIDIIDFKASNHDNIFSWKERLGCFW